MEKLTDNQLKKIPDNWKLDHNIRDIEYWFRNKELDIDIQLSKTFTVDNYKLWQVTFLVDGGGWNRTHRKLKNAFKEALDTMKDFN